MDRGMLVGNRLCAKRVELSRKARHKDKMLNMKPGVDNKVPFSASLSHLRSNRKREQLQEDNCTEIDRVNRILLQRMSEIITKPAEVSFVIPEKKVSRSLNHETRQKELKKITNENLAILKRIQRVQPAYDHVMWEQDYRRTREYMKNSCELPIVLGSTHDSTQRLASDRRPESEASAEENSDQIYQEEGVGKVVCGHPQFRYLAKDGRKIGDTFYLIEVSTDGVGLLITAFSGQEEEDELELYLDGKGHAQTMARLNGDYSKLIDRVRVGNGRIIILPC
jgi:hypothetical protein